jgi:hypothetical protein
LKTALLLLFFSFAASLPVASQTPAESGEHAIQGTWYLSGQVRDTNVRPGLSWFLEWTFDQGKFNLAGYPPLHQNGSYRIIRTEGNRLTLELYDQQGNFGTEKSQIEILLQKNKDRLTIKGRGPFKRTKQ